MIITDHNKAIAILITCQKLFNLLLIFSLSLSFRYKRQDKSDDPVFIFWIARCHKDGKRGKRRRGHARRVQDIRLPQKPHERICAAPFVTIHERMILDHEIQ